MNMLKCSYQDTDSVKQFLNSKYGKELFMKDYICVFVDRSPMIIFKSHICAVSKNGERASIMLDNGEEFHTDNKYNAVAKMLCN